MLGHGAEPASWATLHTGTLQPGTVLGATAALFPRIEQSVEELRQMANDTSGNTQQPAAPAPQTARPAPARRTAAPAAAASTRRHALPPAPLQPASAGQRAISIDDFMKVELRVAKVLTAERVPKSKKLLKLHVDIGTDQRTIVAGIAEAYEPEALVGRTIAIVFNLKPAKLMGIESNGMVLAASPEGGKPILVGFDEPLPPGSRVR